MIRKKILNPCRIRRISGSFGFLPHRLITGGFLAALSPHELLLYFFLVLVADRHGLSFMPMIRSARFCPCPLTGISKPATA